MIARELRDAVGQIRDADLMGAAFKDAINTTKVHGRQIFAIGIAGAILDGAGYSDQAFDAGVVRSDFVVSDRPIGVVAIARGSLEIDIAEARGRAPPEIRFAPDSETAPPGPLRAGCGGEGDIVLPNPFGVFVIHVADIVLALLWIAKAAKGHIIWLLVVAKVFLRIEAPAPIQGTHTESGLAECVKSHATARAGTDHDDVIGFGSHIVSTWEVGDEGAQDRLYADTRATQNRAGDQDHRELRDRSESCNNP